MFDIRPVGYVIGLLLAILGATMFLPFLVDLAEGRGHWPVFLQSGLITVLAGGLISLACANGVKQGLSIQQTFLLTPGVWLALPVFGALPFVFGYRTVVSARALAATLVIEASTCWHFWAWEQLEMRLHCREHFTVNVAVAGGLLLVQEVGGGRYAVDAILKRD